MPDSTFMYNFYVIIFRNITEKGIDDIFHKYGRIVQKNILKDKLTGLPRGVAFVRYTILTQLLKRNLSF